MAKQKEGGGSVQSRAPWMVGEREMLPQERTDSGPMVHSGLQEPILSLAELVPEPWRTHGRSLGVFVGSHTHVCLF